MRFAALALCPSCYAARSTVGKGQPAIPLPPGPDVDVLAWIATAYEHTNTAERTLAAAVTRAGGNLGEPTHPSKGSPWRT